MRTKTEFPRTIREIPNVWIPMADGIKLGARIWLPEDADENPVPAIVEYLPYRKDDFTALVGGIEGLGDSTRHPYFAGHGYASIRLDMRGSGSSDGTLYDEYLPQEQDDMIEALAWLGSQPWCTGDIGMIGISWGGFNGLQVAARRPPELKAIISCCSTDDRYADDVHYIGGCINANDMLEWASTMVGYNARPPDPRHVGDRWRDMWLARLEKTPPFIESWLSHQRRDDYWKHGSVCENHTDITCAVYLVGGWADGYTNPILRMLEGLDCPRKGLIGPWAHTYPEMGTPGPAIGFLQECLRWWDYWLKGTDTGIMDEPMLRAYMLNSVEQSANMEVWPGRWVAEEDWPAPSIDQKTFVLNGGSLDENPKPEVQLDIKGSQIHGLEAGYWCAYGMPGDLPGDQRIEDGLSLTFTSAPIEEPMEILGFPEVKLTLASDRPIAYVIARLCDVSPTGSSTLVSRGVLNLTHRDSHEHPVLVEPGKRYTVTFRLNACGYSLPIGHRWRLALSPTYWPWVWPSPEPVTLRFFSGDGCRLTLPVRSPKDVDELIKPFEPPERSEPEPMEMYREVSHNRIIDRDLQTGEAVITDLVDDGHRKFLNHGLEYAGFAKDTYSIVEGDPLSAEARFKQTIEIGRGDWQTHVEVTSSMTSDADNFLVTTTLDAYEGEVRVFAKNWRFVIPRDFL